MDTSRILRAPSRTPKRCSALPDISGHDTTLIPSNSLSIGNTTQANPTSLDVTLAVPPPEASTSGWSVQIEAPNEAEQQQEEQTTPTPESPPSNPPDDASHQEEDLEEGNLEDADDMTFDFNGPMEDYEFLDGEEPDDNTARGIMMTVQETMRRGAAEQEAKKKAEEEASVHKQHLSLKQRFAQAGSRLASTVRTKSCAPPPDEVPFNDFSFTPAHPTTPAGGGSTANAKSTHDFSLGQVDKLRKELDLQRRLLYKKTNELKISQKREETTRLKFLAKIDEAHQQAQDEEVSSTSFLENETFIKLVTEIEANKGEFIALQKKLCELRADNTTLKQALRDTASTLRNFSLSFAELRSGCLLDLKGNLISLQRDMREALFEVLDFTPDDAISSLDIWGFRLTCTNMLKMIAPLQHPEPLGEIEPTPIRVTRKSELFDSCPFQNQDKSAYIQCYVSCVRDMQVLIDKTVPKMRDIRIASEDKIRQLEANVASLEADLEIAKESTTVSQTPSQQTPPKRKKAKHPLEASLPIEESPSSPRTPTLPLFEDESEVEEEEAVNDIVPETPLVPLTVRVVEDSAALREAEEKIVLLEKEIQGLKGGGLARGGSGGSVKKKEVKKETKCEENFYVAISNMVKTAKKMKLSKGKFEKLRAMAGEAMALSSESAKSTWRILCERLHRANTMYHIAPSPAPPSPPPQSAPHPHPHPPTPEPGPPLMHSSTPTKTDHHQPPPKTADQPKKEERKRKKDDILNSAAIREHIVFCWRCGDGPYGPPHRVCENCEKKLYYGVFGTIAFSEKTKVAWKRDVASWIEQRRALADKKRLLIRRASLILGGEEARTLCDRYLKRQDENRNRHAKLLDHLERVDFYREAPMFETKSLASPRRSLTASTLNRLVPTSGYKPKCKKAVPTLTTEDTKSVVNAVLSSTAPIEVQHPVREDFVLTGQNAYNMVSACDLVGHPSASPYLSEVEVNVASGDLTTENLEKHNKDVTPATGLDAVPTRPIFSLDIKRSRHFVDSSPKVVSEGGVEPPVQQPPVAPYPGSCGVGQEGISDVISPEIPPMTIAQVGTRRKKTIHLPSTSPEVPLLPNEHIEAKDARQSPLEMSLGHIPAAKAPPNTSFVDRYGVRKNRDGRTTPHTIDRKAYSVGYQRGAELCGRNDCIPVQDAVQTTEFVISGMGAVSPRKGDRPLRTSKEESRGATPSQLQKTMSARGPSPVIPSPVDLVASFVPLKPWGAAHQCASWTPGSPCPIAAVKDIYVSEAAATVPAKNRPQQTRPVSARVLTASQAVPNLSLQRDEADIGLEWGSYKASKWK